MNFKYEARIKIIATKSRSEETARNAFNDCQIVLKTAASSKGWEYVGEQDSKEIEEVVSLERPKFILPSLTPEVINKHFGKLYDRDPHIRLIHDSAATHFASNGEFRTHVLLYGPAASAKTTLLTGFKELYEPDGTERVLMIDATTSSKAGFETTLLNRAVDGLLPEFIYIEEIEKQMRRVPAVFNALLSIMDSRGMISRNNARIGHVTRKTPVTVWATSNDEHFIKNYDSGAIWSRFQRRIRCDQPTREMTYRILEDKIKSFPEGKTEWIIPALIVGWDVLGSRDPREIIAIALDGKDRLLDGSFQRDLLAVTEPYVKEDKVEEAS